MSERVMMPQPRPWVGAGEIATSVRPTPLGTRFTMDVADDLLAKIGPLAVEHVGKKLADIALHEHGHLIESAVVAYLRDRAWAEPIIREAIRESVSAVVRDMLKNSPFGDAFGGAS